MNRNKNLAKLLCTSMMIGNITPAFATVTNETNTYDDTTENVSKETEVLYQKAGNYFVTIPKTISLGADKQSPYSVKVEGDIPSDKQVYVSPIDSIKDTEDFDFYMHDTNTTNPKADVVATVTQNKFFWNFSEVANGYTETNNKVTALDLTSGTWKGTFDFEINMKAVNGEESHTHSYTETIIKEPTCTEDGEKKITCSCGDTKTESIPSTGHNIVDGNCTECGAVVKTIEDLMNGDVSYEQGTILSVKEANTLKVNDTIIPEKTFTFDKEGDYQVTVETTDPATNAPIIINLNITIIINQGFEHTHIYTETIIKAATCTENGEKKLICSCGDSKTESIPSTGHTYGTDDKCTTCGELNPNHTHNYTETIIKEASCIDNGEKHLTCSCGDSKTEIIPSTGHNYADGTCTDCGDAEQCEHNFVSKTFNVDWVRESDGTNGLRWEYESATTNSTRYKANGTSEVIGSWNKAETIWKITVPISCTTQIGFKPYSTSTTANPSAYIYFNDKEIWNNNESYASSKEYKYRTVTLQPGDNYIRATGYRYDRAELFKVTGEYQECSICGEKLSNWQYTLNETDKTITLNRYIGADEDVIVHSTYKIGGTTYKTKIASNPQSWSSNYMFGSNKNIKTVTFEKNVELPDSIAGMFRECSSLISVDMSNLDTSNVTDMSNLFHSCTSLTSVKLNGLNTCNVTNINFMFNNCSSLTNIDLSDWDTKNVTSMAGTFSGCSSLTNIDLSDWNTSNVTAMNTLFINCTSLTNINLNGWNTSNVTDMSSMFNNCTSLTRIDLSNFDTGNVTNMVRMFYSCVSLVEIDLSKFDTKNVTRMDAMFSGCTALNTIYVAQNKWSTEQANITDMFTNCGTSSVTYK